MAARADSGGRTTIGLRLVGGTQLLCGPLADASLADQFVQITLRNCQWYSLLARGMNVLCHSRDNTATYHSLL